MIALSPGGRVYLACGVTDMRKGAVGLAMLVQQSLAENPFDGAENDKLRMLIRRACCGIGSAAAPSSWEPINCSSGWKIWSKRPRRTKPARKLPISPRADSADEVMLGPIGIMVRCRLTCRAMRL
jgi:IS66 Orf2 like protein